MFRPSLSVGLILAVFFPASVFAHDPGLSSAQLARSETGLEIRLTFAWSDLAPVVSETAANELPSSEQLAALGPELTRINRGFAEIVSDEGERISPVSSPVFSTSKASANEVIVLLGWPRVSSGALRLEFPVLAKMPFGHRMLVTLGNSTEPIALLDPRHAVWELSPDSSRDPGLPTTASAPSHPSRPGAFSFIPLGVEHILTGFDHLCFLFALLLVAPRIREVLAVVTAFTIAHSLTLAAAAMGVVSLSPRVVEPLIAASIVYIGIENLFLRRPPRHRVAVVFGFGLIHGLGFASALTERLPGATGFAIVPPLLGFNFGVELGQLAVAACLVPLIGFLRNRPTLAPRLRPAFSLAISVAGIVWFCQRV